MEVDAPTTEKPGYADAVVVVAAPPPQLSRAISSRTTHGVNADTASAAVAASNDAVDDDTDYEALARALVAATDSDSNSAADADDDEHKNKNTNNNTDKTTPEAEAVADGSIPAGTTGEQTLLLQALYNAPLRGNLFAAGVVVKVTPSVLGVLLDASCAARDTTAAVRLRRQRRQKRRELHKQHRAAKAAEQAAAAAAAAAASAAAKSAAKAARHAARSKYAFSSDESDSDSDGNANATGDSDGDGDGGEANKKGAASGSADEEKKTGDDDIDDDDDDNDDVVDGPLAAARSKRRVDVCVYRLRCIARNYLPRAPNLRTLMRWLRWERHNEPRLVKRLLAFLTSPQCQLFEYRDDNSGPFVAGARVVVTASRVHKLLRFTHLSHRLYAVAKHLDTHLSLRVRSVRYVVRLLSSSL
jgi:hypothetical protein